MLQKLFRRRYLESLKFYKHFYDDIYEYGNRDDPTKVFYFVPGISGVPGQVRFILPSLYQADGAEIYVRCCRHPAFSATVQLNAARLRRILRFLIDRSAQSPSFRR